MIFQQVIPQNNISVGLDPSRPSGLKCIDDMFGGGYPAGRIIHIHSESTTATNLLVMKTMVSSYFFDRH